MKNFFSPYQLMEWPILLCEWATFIGIHDSQDLYALRSGCNWNNSGNISTNYCIACNNLCYKSYVWNHIWNLINQQCEYKAYIVLIANSCPISPINGLLTLYRIWVALLLWLIKKSYIPMKCVLLSYCSCYLFF